MRSVYSLSLLLFVATLALACAAPAAPTDTPLPAPSPTPASIPATPTATEPLPTPTATPRPLGPVVRVGESTFTAEVADTQPKRAQGLSERPSLVEGTGMLFIFRREGRYPFWMNKMQFPLDIVWISSQCAVVDITRDVPHPVPGDDSDLPLYQPSQLAQFVLEINAGVSEAQGIDIGDVVSFEGTLAGEHDC